jgi:hypothetical protein
VNDPDTTNAVREMLTKGASDGTLFFNTDDAFQAHAALKGKDVEIAEEPTEQSYGIDFGLRDPFGNIRFAQRSTPTPKPTPEARGTSATSTPGPRR